MREPEGWMLSGDDEDHLKVLQQAGEQRPRRRDAVGAPASVALWAPSVSAQPKGSIVLGTGTFYFDLTQG
ncbi:MAG TPA: hypothetical protein VKW70_05000 [Terriglobia bacterium]|nr:hypothetical protein [Terriglobia bacterium]